MTNAYGYTRLSQASDTSIDNQAANIEAYADEHGFTLVDILDDGERSSGFETESREAYQELVAHVKSGAADAIVVNDKRRLARDFDDTMQLVLDLRKHDVEVHTHQSGQLDLSDPMHAAIEVLQAASEHEAKIKEIERAKEAIRRKQDQGHDLGPPKLGMEYNDAKTRQVPGDDFEKVERIFELRDAGETYPEIADEVGVAISTAHDVVNRREWYAERSDSEIFDQQLV